MSLDYLFDKKSSAFLSCQKEFPLPRFRRIDPILPSIFQVNPGIKPQTGYQYEAGVRHAFTDQIEANLTLFWIETRERNLLQSPHICQRKFPEDPASGNRSGSKGETSPMAHPLGKLQLHQPHPHGKARNPFSGNDIPGVPRHKGSVGADVDFWKCIIQFKRIPVEFESNHCRVPVLYQRLGNQVERLQDIILRCKALLVLEGVEGLCRRQ